MTRIHIGEFEELILLATGILYSDPYAVAIANEIASQTGREVNVSAVHKSLYRLEEKGMLRSRLSDPESKRGGKRKRLFFLTSHGKKALDDCMEIRNSMHKQIPKVLIKWTMA
ncbi:MAG: helix-turn-helix transcriptional regulator [Chitinophagaceae bacterium]|jgi:DNA-binding PadR family transcriptional regulator|nr:helix-turn-helix transcriptional regulator [Chitinophagaceae bacterium]